MLNLTAYDASKRDKDQDDLDRWSFAEDIADLICSTDPDWSARIGIFGKWGEGKSVVVDFVRNILVEKSHVVVNFQPWSAQNWDELWEEFAFSLLKSLEDAGVSTEARWKGTTNATRRSFQKTNADKAMADLAEAAGLPKTAMAARSAFVLLNHFFKHEKKHIEAIRKKLTRNRRIVVVIDDLDRCAPDLIPQLLLSLRELLDVSGFTFLLAFDPDIVSIALEHKHPSWKKGSEFLEKILDFRYTLPTLTLVQKRRLLVNTIQQYGPHIPVNSVKEVEDLLPDNPRKLIALVRSFQTLLPYLKRLRAEEYSWVDLWLIQLVRLESPAYAQYFINDGARWSARAFAVWKDEPDEPRKRVARNAKSLGITDPVLIDRLSMLMEACRARASRRWELATQIVSGPIAVTPTEVDACYRAWAKNPGSKTIEQWIKRHADDRSLRRIDVEHAMFEAILRNRHAALSAAADSISTKARDELDHELRNTLRMCRDLIDVSGDRLAIFVHKLVEHVTPWRGFREGSDRDLRQEEERLLEELARSSDTHNAEELVDLFEPWKVTFANDSSEIRYILLKILLPKLSANVIAMIKEKDGVRRLSEVNRFQGRKYFLFGDIQIEEGREELLAALKNVGKDPIVHENLVGLLELTVRALDKGVAVNATSVMVAKRDGNFLEALWAGATSLEISFRYQLNMLQLHHELTLLRVTLPLPKELIDRVKELKRMASAQTPVAAE